MSDENFRGLNTGLITGSELGLDAPLKLTRGSGIKLGSELWVSLGAGLGLGLELGLALGDALGAGLGLPLGLGLGLGVVDRERTGASAKEPEGILDVWAGADDCE